MNKFFSFLLSLIVLLSSLNFKLSAHYCGKQLVDVALFGQAEPCLMAIEKDCESDEMPCCADRDLIITGEDYLFAKDFKNLEIKKTEVLVSILIFPISLLIDDQNVSRYTNKHYTPPKLEQKSQVLYQSFLL